MHCVNLEKLDIGMLVHQLVQEGTQLPALPTPASKLMQRKKSLSASHASQ